MSYALDLPCPACGASRSTCLATRDQILAEVEALWDFHGARLEPRIPPRSLLDRVVFSQAPPLQLVTCDGCGTVLRQPRERPEAIEEVYQEEAADPAVLASLFEAQRSVQRAQARRLTRALGWAGSGLEVGSYVGAFLAEARTLGWRFEGLDVNAGATAFARERGLAVQQGTLESVAPGRRFDAVAIWNCFEQLPDPRRAARLARERLTPRGVLALRVPNGAFYAALRSRLSGPLGGRAAALLALNNLLTFPYRHGFTPASLGRLLHDTGFQVVHTVGDVLVPTSDRWTRRWAALEERALKAAWRSLARLRPAAAPWVEVYARVKG